MDRGLVVVEDTPRHAELLREAEQCARGGDADLVVLAFATEEEIGPDVRRIESIGEIETVSDDAGRGAVVEAAEAELAEFARQTLGETDVEYEVSVEVLSRGYGTGTLEAAEAFGCDRVFVAGRQRSPAGKAVFGDWVQRVLLGFDGHVTVSLGPK